MIPKFHGLSDSLDQGDNLGIHFLIVFSLVRWVLNPIQGRGALIAPPPWYIFISRAKAVISDKSSFIHFYYIFVRTPNL